MSPMISELPSLQIQMSIALGVSAPRKLEVWMTDLERPGLSRSLSDRKQCCCHCPFLAHLLPLVSWTGTCSRDFIALLLFCWVLEKNKTGWSLCCPKGVLGHLHVPSCTRCTHRKTGTLCPWALTALVCRKEKLGGGSRLTKRLLSSSGCRSPSLGMWPSRRQQQRAGRRCVKSWSFSNNFGPASPAGSSSLSANMLQASHLPLSKATSSTLNYFWFYPVQSRLFCWPIYTWPMSAIYPAVRVDISDLLGMPPMGNYSFSFTGKERVPFAHMLKFNPSIIIKKKRAERDFWKSSSPGAEPGQIEHLKSL